MTHSPTPSSSQSNSWGCRDGARHTSQVTRHTSHITRHTSHITCSDSPLKCCSLNIFNGFSSAAARARVLYRYLTPRCYKITLQQAHLVVTKLHCNKHSNAYLSSAAGLFGMSVSLMAGKSGPYLCRPSSSRFSSARVKRVLCPAIILELTSGAMTASRGRLQAWLRFSSMLWQGGEGVVCGVWGLGFRVWGLGFGVWDLGFRFH